MKTQDMVLGFLEKRRGEFVSGEDIGNFLNLSRNAIWKAISKLKEDGYNIESKNKYGYMLIDDNNRLNGSLISNYLQTQIFGQEIIVFDEVNSTNTKAKELSAQGAISGTLIVANSQSNGRGRRGRNFYSPKNTGIYMSLIIRPKDYAPDLIKLTTMAALALCMAIEKTTSYTPQIKWVNDVILNGRKLSGILTEATTNLEDGSIDAAVLGIGINFATEIFPEEINGIATSLNSSSLSRNQLIGELLNQLEIIYNNENITPHMSEYKKRLIVLNKEVSVLDPKGVYKAKVVDLDNNGGLVIQISTGEIKVLNSGEISIKGEYQN